MLRAIRSATVSSSSDGRRSSRSRSTSIWSRSSTSSSSRHRGNPTSHTARASGGTRSHRMPTIAADSGGAGRERYPSGGLLLALATSRCCTRDSRRTEVLLARRCLRDRSTTRVVVPVSACALRGEQSRARRDHGRGSRRVVVHGIRVTALCSHKCNDETLARIAHAQRPPSQRTPLPRLPNAASETSSARSPRIRSPAAARITTIASLRCVSDVMQHHTST
jgi:hypothetical protein